MSAEMNEHGDRDVEAALRALSPAVGSLDRDRLMFMAGQAAADRPWGKWFWPLAAATASLAAGIMAIVLAIQPAEIERIVYRPVPAPPPLADEPRAIPAGSAPAGYDDNKDNGGGVLAALASFWAPESTTDEDHYLAARNRVLRLGVHMLAKNAEPAASVARELPSPPILGATRLRQYLQSLEP